MHILFFRNENLIVFPLSNIRYIAQRNSTVARRTEIHMRFFKFIVTRLFLFSFSYSCISILCHYMYVFSNGVYLQLFSFFSPSLYTFRSVFAQSPYWSSNGMLRCPGFILFLGSVFTRPIFCLMHSGKIQVNCLEWKKYTTNWTEFDQKMRNKKSEIFYDDCKDIKRKISSSKGYEDGSGGRAKRRER